MLDRMSERWPAWCGPIWRFVDRNYRRARRTLVGLGDARRIRRKGLSAIPPARLRGRVHGHNGIKKFLTAGKRARDRIEEALIGCGHSLGEFGRVLDFGCGCGRVLRWFEPLASDCELHGSDVDPEAIAWCSANLPYARFRTNDALPPLPHDPGSFDLVYAISVMTHLDEERQVLWLEELKRVTSPGGLVVLSILGEGGLPSLREDERARVREHGLVHIRTDRWRGMLPDWYQVTVHDPEYARTLFGKVFEIVAYVPGGLTKWQDLVVLRHPV